MFRVKPKAAYVLFGEHVRLDPALSGVPLADIEKAIERRWRELPQEERVNKWERPASLRLQDYQKKLKKYEQTEHFQTYQTYLEAFEERQHSPEIRPDSKASFTSATAPSVPQPVHTEQEDPDSDQHMIFGTYGPDSEGQSHDAASPVRCGMVEVRNYLTIRGINPHLIRVKPYPTEGTTTQAVEDFLNGTGALLHLWNREEAMDLIRSVYRPENDVAALNLGRQQFISLSYLNNATEEQLQYWWNVFRSVLFLESWFAYNTNLESRVTHEDLNLYHAPSSQAENEPATLHEHILKLGQLSAYIALDLKTAALLKSEQVRAHLGSLNEWHRKLPPPMQLSRLSLTSPFTTNLTTKRSLLQTHILFLGIFVEPYRKYLVDLGSFRLSNELVEFDGLEDLEHLEEQCILAARQSARVASLLQIDNLVRAHCWVSIYTSFTSCAILLFSASQKLLGLYGEEVGQDLSYASSHLNLLSLCSYDNSIARKLYTQLQIDFNEIREVAVSPVYREMRNARIFVKDPRLVPRSYYDPVLGAEELSKAIVDSARSIMGTLKATTLLKE
ncbi:uncharacterized protein ALTATR162_LOCUS9432 [Alternaria atra]|uniref:HMG box domain-containing protein n=1 Tax=Alternaria atra TaxID=119953 RepID=A0A8J2I7F7_9PLEO|nr:uncharacterized protein ALTATR162_LOCUS9432 [Alternaria atra]CAG5180806.1 unnamed protein product [Alternaria atra]